MFGTLPSRKLANSAFHLAVNILPTQAVTKAAGGGVIAPCYHLVSPRSPVHTRHLFQEVDLAGFEADLDFLLKHFTPLSLSELKQTPHPESSFFLSFDDGFREMSEIVAPVCLRKGVPATFFLTTGFLDNRMLGFRHKASLLIDACESRHLGCSSALLGPLTQLFGPVRAKAMGPRAMFLAVKHLQAHVLDECAALLEVDFDEYLRAERPYLTSDQVSSLIASGFSIGGHSIDHPLYTDVAPEEQIAQTAGCMQALKARFGVDTKAFAFPFVSDGVGADFYETVVQMGVADTFFCIGGTPRSAAGAAGAVVQRFGVESAERSSVRELIHRHMSGRLKRRISAWRTEN